jgi:hypothetical protein
MNKDKSSTKITLEPGLQASSSAEQHGIRTIEELRRQTELLQGSEDDVEGCHRLTTNLFF